MANKNKVSPDADASLADELATETPPPPADAPAGDAPPVAAVVEKLTPTAWARRKGFIVEGQEPYAKGFHSSAEQLHGWAWHAHNFQNPKDAFELTEADYDAALVAASQFPAKPAHEAALAPHFPKPVVPKQIADACAAADLAAAELAATVKKG